MWNLQRNEKHSLEYYFFLFPSLLQKQTPEQVTEVVFSADSFS